jgi:hypothetical protein
MAFLPVKNNLVIVNSVKVGNYYNRSPLPPPIVRSNKVFKTELAKITSW